MTKKKISKRKSILVLLIFLVLVLSIFLTLFFNEDNQSQEQNPLDIVDSLEFITLENPDTSKYIVVISPAKAVDVLTVAEYFYGHRDYWSYIYRDNKFDNLLSIPSGAVVKIPIVDSVGYKNSLTEAKLLGDSLLEKYSTEKGN